MSEAATSAQESASNGQATSAASSPATPAAKQEPSQVSVSMTSEQLKARLDEAKDSGIKAVLKEFGFETKKDLQAILTFAKQTQDKNKTDLEKAQAELEALKPKAAKFETLQKRYEASVNAKFDALPEEIRSAIQEAAGDDIEERDRMMGVFEKAGALKGAPAKPAGAPPLANTSNAAPPPSPAQQKTAFDAWQELKQSSPAKASIFYSINQIEIEKSRPIASG